MRRKLIAGNWKMYKTPQQSLDYVGKLLPLVGKATHDIALFPSDTSLVSVLEAAQASNVAIGAQNMHWLDEGAYTGQTSPSMLTAIGCTHVLLGHSECRRDLQETDRSVNLKLKAALAHSLVPVVCVGESLETRKADLTEAVLRWQVAHALNGITAEAAEPIVIAYEPIWAIGTGVTASPAQAAAAHAIIRREVASLLGNHRANTMHILYGGSVKPDNTAQLMAQNDIDGALVGGASLDPESFAKIVNF